jgi:DNA-directed RNA polymerase subunit RPC12/RpoP
MDTNNQPITDALQTKCGACGGFMEYSPAAENLKCKYCGNITELDKTAAVITENDFLYWKDRADENAGNAGNTGGAENAGNTAGTGNGGSAGNVGGDMAEAPEIKCRQCGATTSLPPNVSGAKCAFCGTPLIMSEATVKRFWQPNYLLPFKISDRESGKNFGKWLANKWLAPSKLKKSAVSFDAFKGVYLPFWTYDANTSTEYRGKRGIRRKEKYTNKEGKAAERTVTDWYHTSGNVRVEFDDVLVPASKTLPPAIADSLVNWDLMNCVAFRKEFLAGFITELYQSDFRDSLDAAKKKMEPVIETAIRKDIGGDEQQINTKTVQYSDVKFKHLLLPVWISAFRYNNKLYQFVVNGRTGQVTGQYPKSTAKIVSIVLAVIAVAGALWYFFG